MGMLQIAFELTWGIFWRWSALSFISGFLMEFLVAGILQKSLVQIPLSFLTLWGASKWFLVQSRSNKKPTLAFTWNIFWRWYVADLVLGSIVTYALPNATVLTMPIRTLMTLPAMLIASAWALRDGPHELS
jgi:hypothetical protein